jgi:hypothetical protein
MVGYVEFTCKIELSTSYEIVLKHNEIRMYARRFTVC